jgi:hypothetical protein
MLPLIAISSVLMALAFSSCAQTTVGDVRVHALLGTPPPDAIRAVIAANPTHEKIYDIQIVSGSEMHVYYHPISEGGGYAVVKRVNGKWQYIEKVFFTS